MIDIPVYNTKFSNQECYDYPSSPFNEHFSKSHMYLDDIAGSYHGTFYAFVRRNTFLRNETVVMHPIAPSDVISIDFLLNIERQHTSWANTVGGRIGLVICNESDGNHVIYNRYNGVEVFEIDILTNSLSSDLRTDYWVCTEGYGDNKDFIFRSPICLGNSVARFYDRTILFDESHRGLLQRVLRNSDTKYIPMDSPVRMPLTSTEYCYQYPFDERLFKTVSLLSRDGFGNVLPLILNKV